MAPLISVILTVFNGSQYLVDALSGILSQTYQPIEIIIVDDGSRDESRKIIKSMAPQACYYYQENRGTSIARNQGVRMATGSFLAFLDQDDTWCEHKISSQVSAFETYQELDMVFGHVQQFSTNEADPGAKTRIFRSNEAMPGYLPSALMIKKSSFERVGEFDPTFKVAEWADWFLRAREKLREMMLSDIVAYRRVHENNKGVRQREFRNEYAKALKHSLDRRRTNHISFETSCPEEPL